MQPTYGMIFEFIDGSKPIECEVVKHGMMYALEHKYKAVYDKVNPENPPEMMVLGMERVETGYMEIKIKDRGTLVVCMNNIKTITLDSRWDKLVALRSEQMKREGAGDGNGIDEN